MDLLRLSYNMVTFQTDSGIRRHPSCLISDYFLRINVTQWVVKKTYYQKDSYLDGFSFRKAKLQTNLDCNKSWKIVLRDILSMPQWHHAVVLFKDVASQRP